MKNPPPQASCCVCLKVSNCTTDFKPILGPLDAPTRTRDNFQYSDVHRGWLCRKCQKILEDASGPPPGDVSGTGEVQLSFWT